MNNNVALIRCDSYEQSEVDEAVKKAFDLFGGIKKFIKKGQVVALKCNLVAKATPEQSVTTHPAVVLAVSKLIKSVGADCFVVDSAGAAYTAAAMEPIYQTSGMRKLESDFGVKVNDNYNTLEVEANGVFNKKLVILEALKKADIIFNLCKLKTHGFTGLSNAVKNMFGAIPGLLKAEYHGKFQSLTNFNECLFDIQDFFKDKLLFHISDAIIGMEGDGPTRGTPRKINAIILGQNPASVDVVGAKIMNVEPKSIPTITVAQKRGYLDENLTFDVLGDKVEDFVIKDYKSIMPNEYTPFATSMPKFLQRPLSKWMSQRPIIKPKKCKGCSKCALHCPVKAIEMKDRKGGKYAKVDYTKCIRCFCCQELCPFGVVKIKDGWIYKLKHRKDKK